MARSEYAHITPEMVREACRITRLFFSGRDTESSENTDTRTPTRESSRELQLSEAPQTTQV